MQGGYGLMTIPTWRKKKGFEIIVRFNLAFLSLKDKLGMGTFSLS